MQLLKLIKLGLKALKHRSDFYVYRDDNNSIKFRRVCLFKTFLGLPILSPSTVIGVNQYSRRSLIAGIERVWIRKKELESFEGTFITDDDVYRLKVLIGKVPPKIECETASAVLTWNEVCNYRI